jgi:hypothetical protein
MAEREDGTAGEHIIWINFLLEYSKRRTSLYAFDHLDMLKAYDDIEMSKTMYIKSKSMFITASRGRRIKVRIILSSFGRYLPHGETPWLSCRRRGKYKFEERWRTCTR